MNRLVRLFCVVLLGFGSVAVAQNLGTGLYAFGSFDSRGFDTINLGNLNTHFAIPIVNKPGRGLPFQYSLVYDGLIWSVANVSNTLTWQPDSSWGFHGEIGEELVGYVTYSVQTTHTLCDRGDNGQIPLGTLYANYTYHDSLGNSHLFDFTKLRCPGTGLVSSGSGTSLDASGYTFDGSSVHSRFGVAINASQNPSSTTTSNGTIADTNGNTITNNGNGTFTDTIGVTALTIAGGGTDSSPLTLSYPVTLQADQAPSVAVTISYKPYTVQTYFQCGIGEFGATTVDLIDHITLPDSSASTYNFTYEATPGIPGNVTGRLATITLPTGGTITYSYSGGCNNSGINADGTPATLTRTTSDGPKTYSRVISGTSSSTTITDEMQNVGLYSFTSSNNNLWYETERQIWQGAKSGTPLQDRITQYNGQTTPIQLTAAITQTDTLEQFNGGSQSHLINVYDSSGMLSSSALKQGDSIIQSTTIVYNGFEELTSSTTSDGSGNLIASTSAGYDGNGNQTSTSVATGTGSLDTSTTYNNTGGPISTTTPNGTTQFGYDSTQTFVTSTALPTPSSGVTLSTSASYDSQSGAQISASGVNTGQTVQYTQYDRLLRPASLTLPNGSVITTTYSGNDTIVDQTTGSSADAITHTLVDAYGRKSRVAVFNGMSVNNWYQVDYCYDATGLLQFQTVPYRGGGWATPKQCSGNGTSYTYDALGRVTGSTTADGTTVHRYNGRAEKVTGADGVQRITQHDVLGRVSSICEISGNSLMPQSGAPADCQMDIAGSGFITNYSYDLANHKTTITQGAQQRIFQTDAAGRTIYTSEPERGVTTYSYTYSTTSSCTGVGLCVTRTRPKANQTNPAVMTNTTTQYDSLGRPVSISYDDGVTPFRHFYYDTQTANGIGFDTGLPKGHLVGAIGPSSYELFRYDNMGNFNTTYQCMPSVCDIYQLRWFDLTGNVTTDLYYTSGYYGDSIYTQYGFNPAGQMTSVSGGQNNSVNAPSIVNVTQEGPTGPMTWTLGNGLWGGLTYDSMGRPTAASTCTNDSTVEYCGWNFPAVIYFANEAIAGGQVSWKCDTSIGACQNYYYDEFGRLDGMNANNGLSFSYTYDRYGNRWSQNLLQGSGPSPSYSFNTSTNQITGLSYDAAGNLINDGSHSYQYDAEGNLLTVDGGSTATYVYTALNRRSESRTNGGATIHDYFYNPNGQRSAIWDAPSRTLLQAQTYWGTTPVAYYSGGSIHYQHQDWQGTERARTSANGTGESLYTNLPFGDGFGLSYGSSDTDPHHYAQLDNDSESGTQHAQFRQYSSTQGRWMSPDPYDGSYYFTNPQSFNRYSYALNNPLSNVDPTGQECVWDDGSFDSADDPDTGSPEGCAAQGGTYAIPEIFEGASGHNPGDWSSAPNSGLAADWVTAPYNVTTTPNNSITLNIPMSVWNWAATQTIPTNGLWTYGNWAGSDGMGPPINDADAGAMVHDYCYKQGNFRAGSNFQSSNAQLQACNQALCNTERQVQQNLIEQGMANSRTAPTSRGMSPTFTQSQFEEIQATQDIIDYFTWVVPPGNACHTP
jgi:RHS repeat-associated protein